MPFSLLFPSLFLPSRYFHPISILFRPHLLSLPFLSSLLPSSPAASPSLSPSIPLTLSSLQLPKELSNDLNEAPAFFIFNSPPSRIPRRTQPCTAIRKPAPGAAAFAMSAWRSSLPSLRGGDLQKVGSTDRGYREARARAHWSSSSSLAALSAHMELRGGTNPPKMVGRSRAGGMVRLWLTAAYLLHAPSSTDPANSPQPLLSLLLSHQAAKSTTTELRVPQHHF